MCKSLPALYLPPPPAQARGVLSLTMAWTTGPGTKALIGLLPREEGGAETKCPREALKRSPALLQGDGLFRAVCDLGNAAEFAKMGRSLPDSPQRL